MNRAIFALFAPAIVYAPFFGPLFLLAALVMVVLTAAIGLPLLYLLRAKTTMCWWHCSIAGMLTTLPVVTLLLVNTANPSTTVLVVAAIVLALGVLGGLLFWWLGVYGNSEFPEAEARAPLETLAAIPLVLLAWWYYSALQPEQQVACVLDTQIAAPETTLYAQATVRLKDNQVVTVPLSKGDIADDPVGLCAAISVRRSWTLRGQHYRYRRILPGTCGAGCN
ncbi:MAG: hypothetical protein ACR2PZ_25710 [Pseudomonadales bacterium]